MQQTRYGSVVFMQAVILSVDVSNWLMVRGLPPAHPFISMKPRLLYMHHPSTPSGSFVIMWTECGPFAAAAAAPLGPEAVIN